MSFVPDEDQRTLLTSVRRFVTERSPMSVVRAAAETDCGLDPQLWRTAAGQLGLVGLAVPEEYGGQGFGFTEQALVFEELGRALLGGPYFATVALAVPALLASGDDAAAKEFLPRIVSGSTTATLSLPEDHGAPRPEAVRLRAERVVGRWELTGNRTFVPDGHTADLLLVVAGHPQRQSLFAVEAGASGLRRDPIETLDLTRRQAVVEFSSTPARLIGIDGSAGPGLHRALDLAGTALAMEQVGGAAGCLETAVEYAGTRTQFGRRIGSFQAVKHKLADLLLAVEAARSTAYHAAWVATHAPDDLPVAAAMAQALASEAFTLVAAETVQLHGGIGFTWEHDAHLYFRRAYASAVLLGDADHHRERLAQLLCP